MRRSALVSGLALCLALAACERAQDPTGPAASGEPQFAARTEVAGLNIVLNRPATSEILSELRQFGTLVDQIPVIHAVRVIGPAGNLAAIRALPYVADAERDAQVVGAPIDPLEATDFEDGLSTWNLDAVNVTNLGLANRTLPYDGTGVYVGVLDTGLLDTWRQYFPEQRIAVAYATSFGGGGAFGAGEISDQPEKWQHDTDSHGTHVTSTILGYSLLGTPVNGVAPEAVVIPVKVLNQTGSSWSSVIAHGIVYVGELKAGPLSEHPVVINMSLVSANLDPMVKAAIDYAIAQGVLIVAAAGNSGTRGMGYPAAYAPVISAAAAGWTGQWLAGSDGVAGNWWWSDDVADPTDADDFYITDFSGRARPGQDLDVAAPGIWVVGPYQINHRTAPSYFYLSGTSMASPHVAGIVALLAQQNPSLTQTDAESTLEATAISLPPGSRTVTLPGGATATYSWDADATGAGLVDAEAALGLGVLATTKGKRN
jgi:subtilisin family serine protease